MTICTAQAITKNVKHTARSVAVIVVPVSPWCPCTASSGNAVSVTGSACNAADEDIVVGYGVVNMMGSLLVNAHVYEQCFATVRDGRVAEAWTATVYFPGVTVVRSDSKFQWKQTCGSVCGGPGSGGDAELACCDNKRGDYHIHLARDTSLQWSTRTDRLQMRTDAPDLLSEKTSRRSLQSNSGWQASMHLQQLHRLPKSASSV